MPNRFMLRAGLAIYIGLAVLLVNHLGATYRAERFSRVASTPPVDSVPVPAPRATSPVAVPPTPNGSLQPPPSPPVQSVPAPEIASAAPKPSTLPPAPEETVARTDPVKPASPPSPPRISTLLIQNLPNLSAVDEQRFGELLHQWIITDHPVDNDSPLVPVIEDAVRTLLERRERKDLEIKIVVLDSDEINAFSHLGGYIYVSRGLSNLAATEEEYRFVIGHELAHLDRRHAQQLVAEATREGRLSGVGTLQALYHQIAAGFPEALEFAADDWAVDRMLELEDSKRGCLSFLRKFQGRAERDGYRSGRKPPKSDLHASVQDVENHFRSLPSASTRLARLSKRLNIGPTRKPAEIPPPDAKR